jgi:hypothetical protein
VHPLTAKPNTPHPPATPALSAPIVASPPADLDAALLDNGWDTAQGGKMWEFAQTIKDLVSSNTPILVTPLSWFTPDESPHWFKPSVHYELATDHLLTVMRYTRWLGAKVDTYVAVNELEDTRDTEHWGGIRKAGHGHGATSLAARRAAMAKEYLTIAQGEDAVPPLLINDYQIEFNPRSGRSARGTLARRTAGIQKEFVRAPSFYTTMHAVQKVGAFHWHVGAGYQMHLQSSARLLAAPGLYRAALQNGIRRLVHLGARVTITEMAVTALPFVSKAVKGTYEGLIGQHVKQPKYDPAPNSAWTQLRNTLTQLYDEHGYASTPAHPCWKQQAQVFRQVVSTYLEEPGCNTVIFWGMLDNPTDNDIQDLYGHLFDTASKHEQENTGVYPGGARGCPRKPAYFAVLNALIEAGHALHGGARVTNWLRRWAG